MHKWQDHRCSLIECSSREKMSWFLGITMCTHFRTVWRNRVCTTSNESLCSAVSTFQMFTCENNKLQTILHSHVVTSEWNLRNKIPKFPSPTSLIFSGAAFWTSWDVWCKNTSNQSVTCESIWINLFCTSVVTVVVFGNCWKKCWSVAIPSEINLSDL